jgi:hypothetical protein
MGNREVAMAAAAFMNCRLAVLDSIGMSPAQSFYRSGSVNRRKPTGSQISLCRGREIFHQGRMAINQNVSGYQPTKMLGNGLSW